MFDLQLALRQWRKTARGCSLSGTELDELEDHLCSLYDAHRERGKAPSEAFAIALRSVGALEQVSSEYRKVRSDGWRRLLRFGWASYVLAFFLPVAEGGITLLEPNLREGLLPGFQAVRVAVEEGGWYTVSALTNISMLATMWRVNALGRTGAALAAAVMCGSALLNGWWLTAFDSVRDLHAGYYLWWGSFALASSALLIRARALALRSTHSPVAT